MRLSDTGNVDWLTAMVVKNTTSELVSSLTLVGDDIYAVVDGFLDDDDSTNYAIVRMSFEDGSVIWAKELAFYDGYGQLNLHYTHDIKGDMFESKKLYISALFEHTNGTTFVGNSALYTDGSDLEA